MFSKHWIPSIVIDKSSYLFPSCLWFYSESFRQRMFHVISPKLEERSSFQYPHCLSHFQVTTCKSELWSFSSSSFYSGTKLNRICQSSACCYNSSVNAVSLWLVIMCFLWLLSYLSHSKWKKTTIKNLKDEHYKEKLAKKFLISYVSLYMWTM